MFFVVPGVIVFFVIILAVMGFKIVPQSETMIVERLGKYDRTLPVGINIIWPIIERTKRMPLFHQGRPAETDKIDLREIVLDFPKQDVITKDNVVITVNGVLYFRLSDPVKVAYEVANFPLAIAKLAHTTLRNVMGELDLDESLSSRDTINSKLRLVLDEATDQWGVKVTRVELQDISPDARLKEAMALQMEAERRKRADILESEGKKRSAILEAEGVKEAQINRAEGAKQAKILQSEGEAESIRQVTNAIKESGGDPTQYLIAMRYLETYREMLVSGSKNKEVVYLPYEATGILGAIGGIKGLFGTDAPEAPTFTPPAPPVQE